MSCSDDKKKQQINYTCNNSTIHVVSEMKLFEISPTQKEELTHQNFSE